MDIKSKLAYYLSNFDGYSGADLQRALEENFSADELMELAGTDFMSFDGTFKDQRDADRVIDITLTGGAANDVLYINPGYTISEADNGHPVKGTGTGGNTITVATSPGTAKDLYRWLENVPNNVMGIRITSSDATQLVQNFTLVRKENGPFNDGTSQTVNVAAFTNERDVKDNMVTVNRPFPFDRNTRIAYTVLANKTVTLTLFFGARLDIVQTAQKAVQAALDNKMRQPAPQVINLPVLPGTSGAPLIRPVMGQLPTLNAPQKTRTGANITYRR